MDNFKFLEKYERLKKEIRARRELDELAIIGINVNNTLKYLREIKIIQEAFSKACNDYIN